MAGVLSAVQGKCVVWFGLLCSSFTLMNMGYSKRSYLVPLGNTAQRSVAESNTLASRTDLNCPQTLFALLCLDPCFS